MVDARIIGCDGKILDPRRLHRINQPFGNATQSESACTQMHAIEQQAFQCGLGAWIKFFHIQSLLIRSEEHTSELQSLMRISYAVFCLKKKKTTCKDTQQDIVTNQINKK